MSEKPTISLKNLAWPIMIELLLQFMIGAVDTLMVSRLSDEAVAVVGISNQFFASMIILFTTVSSGAGVLIAQKLGASKHAEAKKIAAMSIVATVIIGIAISIGLYFGTNQIGVLLQVPERLMGMSESYMRIVGCGMAVTSLNLTLNTLLRNTGDTKRPMLIGTFMNLIHIGTNYGFIYGAFGFPQWGLEGVAVSTVASRAIASILLLYSVKNAFQRIVPFQFKDFISLDSRLFRDMLRIGWPMAIGSASWTVSQTILYSFVAAMGAVPLAARTYMGTIESFPIMAGWSIAMALQIQVAQLYGAGMGSKAYRAPFTAFRYGLIFVMSLTIPLLWLIGPIVHIFTGNEDIVAMCKALILLNLLYQPVKMVNMAFNTALVAVGQTRYIMVTNLIFIWTVCIGLSYVLGIKLGLGIIGVYIALILDEGIRGVLVFVRWKKENRNLGANLLQPS